VQFFTIALSEAQLLCLVSKENPKSHRRFALNEHYKLSREQLATKGNKTLKDGHRTGSFSLNEIDRCDRRLKRGLRTVEKTAAVSKTAEDTAIIPGLRVSGQ